MSDVPHKWHVGSHVKLYTGGRRTGPGDVNRFTRSRYHRGSANRRRSRELSFSTRLDQYVFFSRAARFNEFDVSRGTADFNFRDAITRHYGKWEKSSESNAKVVRSRARCNNAICNNKETIMTHHAFCGRACGATYITYVRNPFLPL